MNNVLLPYPPSTNTLYRNVRRVGRVKTDKYKAWIIKAGWKLKKSLSEGKGISPVKGRVSVSISILRPDNRKRDIDNLAKAAIDLLVNHKVIDDDRNIQQLTIAWRTDGPEGAIVEVTET